VGHRKPDPSTGWTLLRTTVIPVCIALLVVLAAGIFAEYQNRRAYDEQRRADVVTRVSVLRAKLEGNINGNIQLVRGLVATLSTEPQMNQERFGKLAGALLDKGSQIRNIAAAPNLIVTLVYPLERNESALGLDYTRNAEQRGSALRARDTGQLVLAGPFALVQGGQGFIGRFPVTYQDAAGEQRFWGIVSAVVDVDRLYRDSGLYDPDLPIEITLSGRDGRGDGSVFYGNAELLAQNPVTADIILPSGQWQIAAIPRGGWAGNPPNTWMLRILMGIAGALILVPTILTGRLIAERHRYISTLRNREKQLERLSHRLRLALDTSEVAVWEMDLDSGSLLWDDRMHELYGYPRDKGPRDISHWLRRVHPEDAVRAAQEFHDAMKETGVYRSQFRLALDNGEVRHIRSLGTLYRDVDETARMIGVDWDVSADVTRAEDLRRANLLTEARNAELEAAKARIEYNALHDSLTDLPNRRFLDEVLAEHAVLFERGEQHAALLHIDLDRFKQINDTLGHAAGDALLRHVANVLREVVPQGDFVARAGGDEFIVLLRRPTDTAEPRARTLARLAEEILTHMRRPMQHEGHECRFGVSIGIASDNDTLSDSTRLLINADIALYRAKSLGRNRYQFFNEALQAEIVNTKRVADDILAGLENDEFIVHYQPQFSTEGLEVIGVEALVRWQHPTEGLLAPAVFMKVAEELNVVSTIDRIVLETALRDMAQWKKDGLAIPKVSVNVSARRLQDEELVKQIVALDIEPGTVSFELVESIFLDEQDELAVWNVERIKDQGIDIEIDDFGTGYASIVGLLKLKPRRLKIARELIMPIVRSPAQRQLVGSIVEIGRSLGIEVLAEGVETMEHVRILTRLGCQALQGYAFARPMAAEDLGQFVTSRRWREAS